MIDIINDLSRSIDLNCVYDFDLVKENNIEIDGKIKSNNIIFNSAILQDYVESIGNRVLIIDDISNQFNDQPRGTRFSIVDTFNLDQSRSMKYLTFVQDVDFTSQAQVLLVSLVHDGYNAYINQYGRCETYNDLGSFEFSIFGNQGNLIFYPTNYSINDYNISTLSFDLRDTISGVGSTDLGDIVFVGSSTTTIPVGVSTTVTISGISSTYRTSKVLVQIGSTNSSYYEFDELTIIHDGSNIYLGEYGQLTTGSFDSYSSSGIGTYDVYYSGSNINIDLITNSPTSVQHDVNSVIVSIANTTLTGIGTETFNTSELSSHYTLIPSSGSPGITTIARFSSTFAGDPLYRGAYYIVSIEDLTNNQYQVSEVVVCYNDSTLETFVSEFGVIQTNSSIGSIGSTVTSGDICLTFIPNPSTEVQVRVYQNAIGTLKEFIEDRTIDFTNAYIRSGSGSYTGTASDIKRSFNLTHKGRPIFERYFDSSSSDVIDIDNNTIRIPEHFFVTGEEVKYDIVSNGLLTERISIASTDIPGIGITDKLPETLYIVKVDEIKVQVSASASESLKTNPNVLDLTSVGIGESHRFISTKQNSKVLIGIDNLIQSPIVLTSVTTTASKDVSQIDDKITFSGITSFFGGDLIKIDDEIMRINEVGIGSTNIVNVRRGWLGTIITTHSLGSQIVKVQGDYNIVDNTINFAESPYGLRPISSTTNTPDERDWIGVQTNSTFIGRSFIRSGYENGLEDSYSKNYIFDSISNNFNGITTQFTLKSSGSNISGFSTTNAVILINDIFQGPSRLSGSVEIIDNYELNESSGITSIIFNGLNSSVSYDVNTSGIPRGGIIISVGSTEGFGYQPIVSAGGTAIVSVAGTIQSISIGNSGSGYRVGIQTVVNVGVGTSSTGLPSIEFIGKATISGGHVVSVAITNPGSGYTSTNPPYVFFEDPLPYSNLPLVYSSDSVSGMGTESKIDIVVGQGSSVINFEIKNLGYGYGQGDILTVDIGGSTGIPTNTSLPFKEFQIFVDKTFSDEFAGWTFGDLQVIDPIHELFDGQRIQFPIKINGNQTTIRSRKGSTIEVKANLLIFINNILQIPDVSYSFEGGSIITFKEAPKAGDTSKILFYKGTGSVDTQNVDILELIEEGDILSINSDLIEFEQNLRVSYDIVSSDIVETNVYSGRGISNDFNLLRPITLCRQTSDKIINGREVSKSRVQYEPLIQPTSNIIQSVSTGSTQIFVESVKTFFDNNNEYLQDEINELPQRKIIITSQDNLVAAAATAVVSVAGTISSIIISDGGVGYSTNPTIIIENPIGLGVTQRATATSIISVGGTVSSITVSSPGTGYTTTNPPLVLIESPTVAREVIDNVSYEGDFGIISGIKTTSVGVATGIVFDLFIPKNSFLRDLDVNSVGIATTGVSGIASGYYFVVYNSNIGYGITSLDITGSVVGVGSSFLDNVYQAISVSIGTTNVIGVGLTYVAKVTVSVEDYNGLTGLGYDSFFGEYSWGRIHNFSRLNPQTFEYYNNGIVGITTSPKVQRFNPLRYLNYNT